MAARDGDRWRTSVEGDVDEEGEGAGEGEEEDGDYPAADLVAQVVEVIDLRDEFGDGASFGGGGHPS